MFVQIKKAKLRLSYDKWIESRWLSIKSVHCSESKSSEIPLESTRISERDRKLTILCHEMKLHASY